MLAHPAEGCHWQLLRAFPCEQPVLQPGLTESQRLQQGESCPHEEDLVALHIQPLRVQMVRQIPGMHTRITEGKEKANALAGPQRLADGFQLGQRSSSAGCWVLCTPPACGSI